MSERYIHMAGHAHLDPVWLWQWPEGFQEVKATFRSALDRMHECPDFVFSASSACFYEWVEQSDPDMFQEIQARVAEGRWEVVGGWWVEPDCNIPGGESFVRQALYGQRYFHRAFGQTAVVGFNADSFGHNGSLPQILQQSGLKYYVFTRPTPHNRALPNRCFWWYSGDGSHVLAYRIPYEYLSWGADLEPHVRRCAAEIRGPGRRIMCFYGVGNHGGGPTRANIASIQRLQAADSSDLDRVMFSRIDQFFEAYLQDGLSIPAVFEDLQHQASGCYAAHSAIKQANRRTEQAILNAESWGITALWSQGIAYQDLTQAWKNLLFVQFHDILAGTSIADAYEDAEHMLGEAQATAQRHLHRSLLSIAGQLPVQIPGHAQSVVVFNSHSWPVETVVEWETGAPNPVAPLLDERGQNVPWQMIQPKATVNGRQRRCFLAKLPAMGYAVYGLGERVSRTQARTGTDNGGGNKLGQPHRRLRYSQHDLKLKTARWQLQFDPVTGALAQWHDAFLEHSVFQGLAARAAVMADPSDTWSHGVLQFHQEVGQFHLLKIQCMEDGPVRTAVAVDSSFGQSTLRQVFVVYEHTERVDVQVTLDWREQHKVLKLLFPVNLAFACGTYDIGYGVQERALDGLEEPGQTWIDISGMIPKTHTAYGVSLLNDGKYSFHMRNTEMAITVLRSSPLAHHDPEPLRRDVDYLFLDQGKQQFWYSILPHTGGWRQCGTVQQAAQLNRGPTLISHVGRRDGAGPLRQSFLSINPGSIVACAMKKSEDGQDLILRCRETQQQSAEAVLDLPIWKRSIAAHFGPGEIKSFQVPRDPKKPWTAVNLLEDSLTINP